jgi:hypothetical protein
MISHVLRAVVLGKYEWLGQKMEVKTVAYDMKIEGRMD